MKQMPSTNWARIFLSVVLTIGALLFFAPTAIASMGDTGTTSDGFAWEELADSKVMITGYSGIEVDLIIPTEISGKAVTQIAPGAFSSNTSIIGVTIQDGVTNIGNSAFAGCSGLTTATLPSSLKSIGQNAFVQCAFTSITLHEGLETIGTCAFNATGLTRVAIPSTVTTMGMYVFAACSALEEATLKGTLTSVGDGILSNCPVLTDVTFACDQLLANSSMLSGCGQLKNVTFDGNWEYIWHSAFAGLSTVESVTLPASLKRIEQNAFVQCALLSITLPEGLETMEFCAFNDTGLTEVTIPSTVNTIDQYCFAASASLEKTVILSKTAVFGEDVFISTQINNDGIYGFAGSTAEAYAQSNGHPFHILHTIVFNEQGGSLVPDQYDVSGEAINEPADPTRDGYDFGGWFETSSCTGDPVSFPHTISGDKLLYAKWNKIYTMSFDSQDGSSITDKSGITGATINEPIPTKSGYDFGGWFETSACTGNEVLFPYTISGDTTLYAKWEVTPQPTPTPSPTPTNTPIVNPETGKPIPVLYTLLFIGSITAIGFVILRRSRQAA